jgi:hypothetical protein
MKEKKMKRLKFLFHNKITKILRILPSEKGFSLFETVVSLVLVGFFIGGLFFAGYFVDNRQGNLEEYWQIKDDLELAYETTHRQLREHAVSNITLLDNGIRFNDEDNNSWSFVKNGTLYQKIKNGNTENLLTNCNLLQFTKTDSVVMIELQAAAPDHWEGESGDLRISGKVFLRNNR